MPITLADVKDHCRVDSDDDDTYLGALIAVAVSHVDCEGLLGRAMVSQEWAQWVPQSPGIVKIKLGPFVSLSGISYCDDAGEIQPANAADFVVRLDGDFVNVRPKDGKGWPNAQSRNDAIQIRFIAGYGAASDVPDGIKHALRLLVGHWYENREAVSELSLKDVPFAVSALIENERVGWYG